LRVCENISRVLAANPTCGWSAVAALLGIIAGAPSAKAGEICTGCISVKLEHPVVVWGPSRHEPDAPVSIIELPDGTFRAFAANGTTVAIDGATPFALGGRSKVVLEPGPAGSPSECGRWLTSVLQDGGALYGLIHNEQHCDYREGETYKSMAIARSEDFGLTWKVLGQIITAGEGPASGRQGGEGDCTAVDGHDGYWYAYCQRLRDWKNTVARAPRNDPAPGKWSKWSGNGWNAPGLGGAAAPLNGAVGMSSAYWTEVDAVLLLATTSSALQLSATKDKLNFATVSEPIILYDANDWKRPAASDLYAYPSMVAQHGFNNIGSHFLLTYTYIPPGLDFTQRYLVIHEASIALGAAPQRPQVRLALSRWTSADGSKWVTTGPPIAAGRSYAFGGQLGYVMTAPSNQSASVKLDECFSARSGNGFLSDAGRCVAEGAERRRVAGFAFRSQQPGTIAIYSCLSRDYERFTSGGADCDSEGTRDRVLGYVFR
jgi:hypothetical protein